VISRFRPEVDKKFSLLGYDTSTHGREDNIKIDIKDVDWIHLAQNRDQ
jgi:hypothetical protein